MLQSVLVMAAEDSEENGKHISQTWHLRILILFLRTAAENN